MHRLTRVILNGCNSIKTAGSGCVGAILEAHWNLRAFSGLFVWIVGNPSSHLIIFKWDMTPWWVIWLGDASLDYASLSQNALIAAHISAACQVVKFMMFVSICENMYFSTDIMPLYLYFAPGFTKKEFVLYVSKTICPEVIWAYYFKIFVHFTPDRGAVDLLNFHFSFLFFMAGCVLLEVC